MRKLEIEADERTTIRNPFRLPGLAPLRTVGA